MLSVGVMRFKLIKMMLSLDLTKLDNLFRGWYESENFQDWRTAIGGGQAVTVWRICVPYFVLKLSLSCFASCVLMSVFPPVSSWLC